MDKKIIGKNTSAILYGENMSRKELLGCTELTTIELASAVGWLASWRGRIKSKLLK